MKPAQWEVCMILTRQTAEDRLSGFVEVIKTYRHKNRFGGMPWSCERAGGPPARAAISPVAALTVTHFSGTSQCLDLLRSLPQLRY
jgi:hypothetical protein